MKTILYFSFYFEPDLCAGSFRNSPLVKSLSKLAGQSANIIVISTLPNRYSSYKVEAKTFEKIGNVTIHRIKIPEHNSGIIDQIRSFATYYFEAQKIVRGAQADLVFASSSRLFTAFLGYRMARKMKSRLYLDIRDIFTDTMKDVIKSRLIRTFLLPVLRVIEKYSFSKASHINLVSEGFKGYFEKYQKPTYSFYTNGIDNVFLEKAQVHDAQNSEAPKVITYAGNIGAGQGLERVIPEAAKQLPEFVFRIIGDGGTKDLLLQKVKDLNVSNVEWMQPVSRQELIKLYEASDYLFLHLNDHLAFKKVLPSKIFEYGAFDKPIIAGVAGYSAEFIQQNFKNYILFDPTDSDSLAKQLKSHDYQLEDRTEFCSKFARSNIMEIMAMDIYKHVS